MSWSLEQAPQNKYMKTRRKIQFQTMMTCSQKRTKGLKIKTKLSTNSSRDLIHWLKCTQFSAMVESIRNHCESSQM